MKLPSVRFRRRGGDNELGTLAAIAPVDEKAVLPTDIVIDDKEGSPADGPETVPDKPEAEPADLPAPDSVSEEEVQDLAEQFRLFSDPTRLKILWALSQENLCVSDLADRLGSTQSAISHQLRLLRQARLIKYEKAGKTSVYQLDDDHVSRILELGYIHISERNGE